MSSGSKNNITNLDRLFDQLNGLFDLILGAAERDLSHDDAEMRQADFSLLQNGLNDNLVKDSLVRHGVDVKEFEERQQVLWMIHLEGRNRKKGCLD